MCAPATEYLPGNKSLSREKIFILVFAKLSMVSPHNPLHWLPAAERGDRQAMLQLGILYERVDDLPRAETWYRQAADAGAPEAQDRLDFLNRRQAQRAADAQAAGPTHPPAEDPP